MPDKPNPKYIVFHLFTGPERTIKDPRQASATTNPVIFDVLKENWAPFTDKAMMLAYVKDTLREHVKTYGTLDEIAFVGHGNKNIMTGKNEKGSPNRIDIPLILEAIANLETEIGVKIAKRLAFMGCSTFSRLSADDIAAYRGYAKERQMAIVGTTSLRFSGVNASRTDHLTYGLETLLTGKINIQRSVCFTADGNVVRDYTDDRFNVQTLLEDDRTWVDYHLGNTQEQAMKAMTQDVMLKARRVTEQTGYIHPSGRSFGVQNSRDALIENIAKVDAVNASVAVVFSSDKAAAVIATGDGNVHGIGNVTLHRMTDAERSESIRQVESKLKESGSFRARVSCDALAKQYNAHSKTDAQFGMVPLKDGKHVLIVTQTGAYEVVDVDTFLPPSPAVAAKAAATKAAKAPVK